jgi:hypothetical protein
LYLPCRKVALTSNQLTVIYRIFLCVMHIYNFLLPYHVMVIILQFPQAYGVQPMVYNAQPGPPPPPQGYMHPSGQQVRQLTRNEVCYTILHAFELHISCFDLLFDPLYILTCISPPHTMF